MSAAHVLSSTETLPKIRDATPAVVEASDTAESASDVPAWLSKDYIEQCLRTHCKDAKLKIARMDARSALGKGENYGGVLTRIKTEYVTGGGSVKTGNYIVKTSFEDDEFARKTMEPYDIFNREMRIYEEVLPKLNALLHEIGDSEQLFADTLAVDYKRSALIFEDLNVRKFTMPDRLLGCDMALSKIVMRKLAKMHATSAVLNERERGCLETYDRGMFNRHTENYAPGYVGLLEACARLVSQWPDFKAYAKKLTDLTSVYMELGKRVFDPIRGHLNVLAHGDLWTNNVMVQYDEATGAPLDAILIDFQYSAWGSPAIDILYYINTSLTEELHLSGQAEIIECYYYTLAETLCKLSYKAPIPTLHRLNLQLEEKAFYAFSSACIVLPIQRNQNTEDADFNAIMSSDERGIRFKDTCYQNSYAQKILRQFLPIFDRRGLLNVEQ